MHIWSNKRCSFNIICNPTMELHAYLNSIPNIVFWKVLKNVYSLFRCQANVEACLFYLSPFLVHYYAIMSPLSPCLLKWCIQKSLNIAAYTLPLCPSKDSKHIVYFLPDDFWRSNCLATPLGGGAFWSFIVLFLGSLHYVFGFLGVWMYIIQRKTKYSSNYFTKLLSKHLTKSE